MRLRFFEFLLIECVFYLLLWLWNEYAATLLSLTFAGIFTFLLIISLLAEWIERSRVPAWYYWFMLASILAPLITALFFIFAMGRKLDWL